MKIDISKLLSVFFILSLGFFPPAGSRKNLFQKAAGMG